MSTSSVKTKVFAPDCLLNQYGLLRILNLKSKNTATAKNTKMTALNKAIINLAVLLENLIICLQSET